MEFPDVELMLPTVDTGEKETCLLPVVALKADAERIRDCTLHAAIWSISAGEGRPSEVIAIAMEVICEKNPS